MAEFLVFLNVTCLVVVMISLALAAYALCSLRGVFVDASNQIIKGLGSIDEKLGRIERGSRDT